MLISFSSSNRRDRFLFANVAELANITKYVNPNREERKMVMASWNVNSIRVRLGQVTKWLQTHEPDVLLLQELKGTEFPATVFRGLGYESAAVTQKGYNGVALLSRSPLQVISTVLIGEETDRQARFLEAMIEGIRIVNVYVPNGNPVGTDKFAYKLTWMDRLLRQMEIWRRSGVPTLVGGDFNVIPEEIDCYDPAAWVHDALFQPETRARYRAMIQLGYTDAFRSLHPGEGGHFTYWDYFRRALEHNRGIRIDHFLLSPALAERLEACMIDQGPRAHPKPSDHTPILLKLRSHEGWCRSHQGGDSVTRSDDFASSSPLLPFESHSAPRSLA